ncbi:MAG: family 43 glycosylhydrolase [Segetibacter sp.]
MSADGSQLDMSSDTIIHQSKGSEANKLYKINGLYYHFFSEVKPEGRVTMMERSKNIYGPYEIKQLNHVNPLKDKEPNQGGLIRNEAGDWWFFTHQGTGDWEGRAACLLPVIWINGWPVIGQPGSDTIGNMVWTYTKPVPGSFIVFPQTDDEFNQDILSVQWEWNYQSRQNKWSLTKRKGFLRLNAFRPVEPKGKDDKRITFYRVGNILTQRSMRTTNREVTIKIGIRGMANGQSAEFMPFFRNV